MKNSVYTPDWVKIALQNSKTEKIWNSTIAWILAVLLMGSFISVSLYFIEHGAQ
jgi:hypothetical protein